LKKLNQKRGLKGRALKLSWWDTAKVAHNVDHNIVNVLEKSHLKTPFKKYCGRYCDRLVRLDCSYLNSDPKVDRSKWFGHLAGSARDHRLRLRGQSEP